jgi:hypothetical protein
VHREDLVIDLRVEDPSVRPGQLESDQQGLDPADDEEGERGDPVQDADALVIDGGQPAR